MGRKGRRRRGDQGPDPKRAHKNAPGFLIRLTKEGDLLIRKPEDAKKIEETVEKVTEKRDQGKRKRR